MTTLVSSSEHVLPIPATQYRYSRNPVMWPLRSHHQHLVSFWRKRRSDEPQLLKADRRKGREECYESHKLKLSKGVTLKSAHTDRSWYSGKKKKKKSINKVHTE